MKKFFREFKEFISRGNIVDLSVAVIIGGAFSAIVTALTDKIIMPLVNWILAICGGSQGLESAYTILSAVYDENGVLDLSKSIYINWGAFISAIINFLIIAFTVFLIIKIINESKKRIEKFNSDLKKETSKEVIKEKQEVRKQAKEQNISFKKAWKEHLKEKEEKAKAEAEAKALEEANKPKPETQEDVLKEIRDLLKANKK
ncbi:MAG: large conductance mechanosensitive channel protein MscL [Clostridiales bacterium]|nr:large conductance mechanosensitive channel protein MscL [Candidatus Apopatousia equi]